jgi:transposase
MSREELLKLNKEELVEIIMALQEQIVALTLRIAELEERLNQNSSNSGKPPSSDGLAKPAAKSLRAKSGKKPGGQKGHKGHGLKIDREPDEEVIAQPAECPKCRHNLDGCPMFHSDTRYVLDVVIKTKLVKYNICETICESCGETVVAAPSECAGTVNYGNALRSLCVVLTNYANVGIDKTHKILRDLIGLPVSAGTVKNIMSEFAGLTEPTIENIKENLLKSTTLNADETGVRVAGRTQWAHVASNEKYTLITVHGKRGKEGSESGGVLPEYTGNLVHDCWKPYFGFDKCKHAVCCAHLLRELNAQIECGHKWAADMKALLLEMKSVVERYKDEDKGELSLYYREKFENRYKRILDAANIEIGPRKTRKKSKAENLLRRLREYREEIMRFTDDFNVPFDNNQAERDIRNFKVKQKVSGCFRTQNGADDFAKTSSVIGTTVKSGKSVFNTIHSLFAEGAQPIF